MNFRQQKLNSQVRHYCNTYIRIVTHTNWHDQCSIWSFWKGHFTCKNNTCMWASIVWVNWFVESLWVGDPHGLEISVAHIDFIVLAMVYIELDENCTIIHTLHPPTFVKTNGQLQNEIGWKMWISIQIHIIKRCTNLSYS